MSTYAIGDLQGCYDSLQALLKKLRYNPQKDFLWFCGDLINRGPDSLGCLDFVRKAVTRGEAITILGNHDLHFLAVAENAAAELESDTLAVLLESPQREDCVTFLRQQPLCHYDANSDFLMVHAGLIPEWNKDDALMYAKEVEKVLQDDSKYVGLLKTMYGNEPDKWSETLAGYERLRFITNVFTRIRFCTESGELNLKDKGSLGSQQANTKPWFQIPNRKSAREKIIFGHWAALYENWDEVKSDYLYPIDSGCVWGNALTALNLETKEYISVGKVT